jgi:hypothetical protein
LGCHDSLCFANQIEQQAQSVQCNLNFTCTRRTG